MKNDKGFTLVEILAAVTILGVLSVLVIGGYTRYVDYARKKAYKTMAKSASSAAEQYVIDNPGIAVETEEEEKDDSIIYRIRNVDYAPGITFKELVEENYMNGTIDPAVRDKNCTGTVRVGLVESKQKGSIDTYIYVVDQCCTNYSARYTYTMEKKNGKLKTLEEVTRPSYICGNGTPPEPTPPKPSPSATSSPTPSFSPDPVTITVNFDCNGGQGGGTNIYTFGIIGQKFDKTCTRAGYKMEGWKLTKAADSAKYKINNGVSDDWIEKNAPEITLYAHWEAEELTCPTTTTTSNGKPYTPGKSTTSSISFTFTFDNSTVKYDWYTSTDNGKKYRKWRTDSSTENTQTILAEGTHLVKLVIYDSLDNSKECPITGKYIIVNEPSPDSSGSSNSCNCGDSCGGMSYISTDNNEYLYNIRLHRYVNGVLADNDEWTNKPVVIKVENKGGYTLSRTEWVYNNSSTVKAKWERNGLTIKDGSNETTVPVSLCVKYDNSPPYIGRAWLYEFNDSSYSMQAYVTDSGGGLAYTNFGGYVENWNNSGLRFSAYCCTHSIIAKLLKPSELNNPIPLTMCDVFNNCTSTTITPSNYTAEPYPYS